ncbi:hypothetical protein Dimus_032361, partial [Dionaea muscipula]
QLAFWRRGGRTLEREREDTSRRRSVRGGTGFGTYRISTTSNQVAAAPAQQQRSRSAPSSAAAAPRSTTSDRAVFGYDESTTRAAAHH